MRKIKIFFMLIAFATFMGGCSSDEVAEILGVMKAKKNGAEWQSSTVGAGATQVEGKFVIFGTAPDGTYITLTTFGIEQKSYELKPLASPSKTEFLGYFKNKKDEANEDSYYAYEGTVTITSVDENSKRVSGTFTVKFIKDLTSEDKIEITEGEFKNLKYL